MKIICPCCQQAIAAPFTNRSKGIVYCEQCSDYFLLDEHLKRHPYTIKREEQFVNTPKPSKTKINIEQNARGYRVTITDRILPFIRFVIFLFLLPITYAIYLTISTARELHTGDYIQLGVLLAFALILILVLVLKGAKTILTIQPTTFQIDRQRYILPSYIDQRKTKGIDTVEVYFDWDHDGSAAGGIEIKFHNEASLRFAHHLSTGEYEWLAGRLIDIRDQLTLDKKVTAELDSKLSKAKTNPLAKKTTTPTAFEGQPKTHFEQYSIVVPKDRNLLSALGILSLYAFGVCLFALVSAGFGGVFPQFEQSRNMMYVFAIFSFIAAFGLFSYLWSFIYRAEHKVFIDADEIRVEMLPLGILHRQVRPIQALQSISKNRNWRCIDLKFEGHRNLRIGFSLTKDELAFLIGELKSQLPA